MKYLFSILTILMGFAAPLYAAPKVVVSFQPIHSLTANLMEGVGEPELLLPPQNSPHHFQLRPSDAKKLHQAELIIWIGPDLETFLIKPLSSLNKNATILTVSEQPSIALLPYQSDSHEHHDHDHEHGHGHGHDHGHSHHLDPHIWLDPSYLKKLVPIIASNLSQRDPLNAKHYAENEKKLMAKLDSLTAELQTTFSKSQSKAFVVFHDGYQYLANGFKLNHQGALTENPHLPLSLHRIQEVKKIVQTKNVVCVFGEPDLNMSIVKQLAENTNAKVAIIDPIGIEEKPGAEAYFNMMKKLSHDMAQCLNSGN